MVVNLNIERLYSLREGADLTQDELADALRISSRTSISDWENGRATIPLEKLNKYSNFFNVSFDYLLGFTDSKDYNPLNKSLDLNLIAERLKELRNKNRLTQELLASELNTTHSTLSAYENAKVLIKTDFVYQIAKNYHVSVDWLLGKIN